MEPSWPRLWTAMATPFHVDGSLDLAGVERLTTWLVNHGTEGIVAAGSTGEGATLSDPERDLLLAACRRALQQQPVGSPSIPLYEGTGQSDTRRTIELSKRAEDHGADGVLVVTPPYNRPTQAGLVAHFTAVARAVSIPVMLYNVPSRTAVTLLPETVARIMNEAPNVLAIKESGGSMDAFTRLHAVIPADRVILSGDDALTLPAMAVGAQGVVSVAAHVAGPLIAAMLNDILAGRRLEALARHHRLAPLVQELFRLPNPIPLKWALQHWGLPAGPPRLPLLPADNGSMQALAAHLATLEDNR